MRQPHRNLFFYYRGSQSKSDDQHGFERQLEDNTTKGLIHVLEHCDRNSVLMPFLNRVAGLRKTPSADRVQFALQRVDIKRPRLPVRIALSIAPNKKLVEYDGASHSAGRPDAWIWADNQFAVLIENKVSGHASRQQIQRHIGGAAGWSRSNARIVQASWSDIYMLLNQVRRSNPKLDPVSQLLLNQFLEFLRMTNLASSAIFELEDFAYFMLPAKERHSSQRALVGRKLHQFVDDLANQRAIRKIMKLYGEKASDPKEYVNPGLLLKDAKSFWITVGPKAIRERGHFTVRISEDGIGLDCFAPHRSYTKRLALKIQAQPKAFVEALRLIPDEQPFKVRLREAYYKNPKSSYKGQRIKKTLDYLEAHPKTINSKNVVGLVVEPTIKRLSKSQFRPEIFLARSFALSELVGKEDVVETVAEAAETMIPYLKFALDLP